MSLSSEQPGRLPVYPLQRWDEYVRAQLGGQANALVVSRSRNGDKEEWSFAHRHHDFLLFPTQVAWLRRQVEAGRLTAADAADPGKVVALGFASPGAPGFGCQTVSHGAVTRFLPEHPEAIRRLLAGHCLPGEADYFVVLKTESGLGLVASPDFPMGADGLPDPKEWCGGLGLPIYGPPQSLLVLPRARGEVGCRPINPTHRFCFRQFMPVWDALEGKHKTDAHAAGYYFPMWPGRVNNNALGGFSFRDRRGKSYPLPPAYHPHMAWFVVDVDSAVAHAKKNGAADPGWRDEEWTKVSRLLEVYPGGYVYNTRGGYRILYRLPVPHRIDGRQSRISWTGFYGACRAHLLEDFGILVDKKFEEWNQLFRLPRTRRPGGLVPENPRTAGDARDIGYWTFRPDPNAPPPVLPTTRRRRHRGATVGKSANFVTALPADADLAERVAKVAAAVKKTDLEANWHHLYLALAVALEGRMKYELIPAFCRAVADQAGDVKASDRYADAVSSLERHAAGAPSTGYQRLREKFPPVADVLDDLFPSDGGGLDRLREQIENAPQPEVMAEREAGVAICRAITRPPPGLSALVSPPGGGKTRAAGTVAAILQRHEGKTVITEPTHAMVEQVKSRIEGLQGEARHLFGVTRKNERTGEPLCALHKVTGPMAGAGVNVRETFCRIGKEDECPHAATCPLALGFDGDGSIVVGVHAMLVALAKEAGDGLLIVDETPSEVWDTFAFSPDDFRTTRRLLDHGRAFGTDYSQTIRPAVEAFEADQSLDDEQRQGVAKLGLPSISGGEIAAVRSGADGRRAKELEVARNLLTAVLRVNIESDGRRHLRYSRGERGEVGVIGINPEVAAVLKREDPTVIMDATLDRRLLGVILGRQVPVTEVHTADGAPITRTVIYNPKANRKGWLWPGGNPNEPEITKALEIALLERSDLLLSEAGWANRPGGQGDGPPCEISGPPADPNGAHSGSRGRVVGIVAFKVIAEALQKAWDTGEGPFASTLNAFRDRGGDLKVMWFGNLRGRDDLMEVDRLVTLGDHWRKLDEVAAMAAYLGLAGEEAGEYGHQLARDELGQAHGRLRASRRTEPAEALHVGTQLPTGWGRDTRVLEMPNPNAGGRPKTQAAMSGQELKDARTAYGATQEEWAKLIGKGVATVRRYEKDELAVPAEVVGALKALRSPCLAEANL